MVGAASEIKIKKTTVKKQIKKKKKMKPEEKERETRSEVTEA